MALVRRLAEHGRSAGEEGHVAGAEGRIRNLALGRLDSGFDHLWSSDQAGAGKAAPADRDAKRAEKFAPIDCGWFVHGVSP